MASPTSPLAVALIAGGRSTRMGQDKARLPMPTGGELWQDRLDLLKQCGTSEIMISCRRDQDFSAEELSTSKKPLILIQAGIHAGEIDGKDAGMMLLRDIAFGNKTMLLDKANLLFVPILNVDGHERSSEFGRVNQRGPKVMGWRTNAKITG